MTYSIWWQNYIFSLSNQFTCMFGLFNMGGRQSLVTAGTCSRVSSPQGLGGVSSKATAGAVTAAPDVRSTVPLQSQGRQISPKCQAHKTWCPGSWYNLLDPWIPKDYRVGVSNVACSLAVPPGASSGPGVWWGGSLPWPRPVRQVLGVSRWQTHLPPLSWWACVWSHNQCSKLPGNNPILDGYSTVKYR